MRAPKNEATGSSGESEASTGAGAPTLFCSEPTYGPVRNRDGIRRIGHLREWQKPCAWAACLEQWRHD